MPWRLKPLRAGSRNSGEDRVLAIRAEDVAWRTWAGYPPEARLAVLIGDPTKRRPYVIRVRVPPGVSLAPHKDAEDCVYTVLSGIFYIGLGVTFDERRLVGYGVGSVIAMPGGQAHFHRAMAGEYIVQVSAIGPLGLEEATSADCSRRGWVRPDASLHWREDSR
jgi:quercetin dioxygenase-like cupin family protein